MNKQIAEWKSQWMSKSMNEHIKQLTNKWMNKSMNTQGNKWTNQRIDTMVMIKLTMKSKYE